MDRSQVARILEEIGVLLELQGENAFKCQAYHRAARQMEALEEPLEDLIARGRLGEVPGIGERLREQISTLVQTGTLPLLEDLRAKTPAGLFEVLRVPGLGPKKVKALHDQLGVDSLDTLRAACDAGQVAALKGFGERTQEKILEGIAFLSQSGGRVRIDQAEALAALLVAGLKDVPGLLRLEVGGSLRRRRETIKDIDLLASARDPKAVMARFVALPQVVQVAAHGETKSSVVVSSPLASGVTMNADLRVVTDKQFPFALHYFTGNKDHNVAMRQRAQDRGLKLNEYELAGPKKSVSCKDEAAVFAALGLDDIPPELREHTGEIEAAAGHTLPDLVEARDICGVFHCHTTWSDGRDTVEAMARAAQDLGLEYLGLADHSQSLTVAGGLSPAQVRKQQAEIDTVNAGLKGFRLFKGIECDILPDGGLDYTDDLLATFDYVVASVHSHFGQSRAEMTGRIIRALEHPRVTMLGHATGRLLLRRDAYAVDLEAVLQAAAAHGKMVEINAHPQRLDLDWIHCKRARALGVKLVINPDAHSTGEIGLFRYGVDVARRGWLEKKDVFNTLPLKDMVKALKQRSGR